MVILSSVVSNHCEVSEDRKVTAKLGLLGVDFSSPPKIRVDQGSGILKEVYIPKP